MPPISLWHLLHDRAEENCRSGAHIWTADGRETRISWRDLHVRAVSIAVRLGEICRPGDRVVLFYPPGPGFAQAFFGCLYARAIAVPLKVPRSPREAQRVSSLLRDVDPAAALSTTAEAARLSGSPSWPGMSWITSDDIPSDASLALRTEAPRAAEIAYLQYTSGSTSDPKGVMISHGNVVENLRYIEQQGAFGADAVSVSWLPHFHDMGLVYGLLQPLYTGFPVYLMSPSSFLESPMRWLSAISQRRATHCGGPNFCYDLCVDKTSGEERQSLDLRAWRVAFNGSEPIRAETLARFAQAFGSSGFDKKSFYPVYGLAEATLKVTSAEPGSGAVLGAASNSGSSNRHPVSSGRAGDTTTVAIVEPDTQKPCDEGQVGEIWVNGPGVAQGYWNRPEETRTTFGAHIEGDPRTYLRTGDLGYVAGGELFVTGRRKDMVIVRGQNHYPQDIESTAAGAHTLLRPSGACFSIPADGEDRFVVVNEVSRRARSAEMPDIIDAIRNAIADAHQIQPHTVVLIKAGSTPKTSSGKIRRGACRELYLSDGLPVVARHDWASESIERGDAELERIVSLPDDPAQRLRGLTQHIAQIVQRVRRSSRPVDLDRPIAAMGLDSLESIELGHILKTTLGISLSPAAILDGRAVSDLAKFVAGLPASTDQATSVEIEVSPPVEAPLSYGQRSLLSLEKLAPSSGAYNVAAAFRVEGRFDIDRIENAWRVLIERHAILRVAFPQTSGAPVQRIAENIPLPIHRREAEPFDQETVQAFISEQAAQPFDLENGPLVRLASLSGAAGEYVLVIALHHAICDLWSLDLLIREFRDLYAFSGPIETLPAKSEHKYFQFVRWQERLLAGEEGNRDWEYWAQLLHGDLPVLQLPLDRPRPSNFTFQGSYERFEIPEPVVAGLKQTAERNDATLFMVLAAAYGLLLHRYTGQPDILIGTPAAGRTLSTFTDAIGYFVSPVVLRMDFSTDVPFESLLSNVRRNVLDALDHQQYPFALLVERLRPVRDPSRSPVFQAMFAFQKSGLGSDGEVGRVAVGAEDVALEIGGARFGSLPLPRQSSQFDISLAVAERNDSLQASIEYSTDLFSSSTIRRFMEHLMVLLEAIGRAPNERTGDLPLMRPNEIEGLKAISQGPAADVAGLPIHNLIEQQAAATPDRVAIAFGYKKISYRELQARADQLAAQLAEAGAGPGSRVAVLMDRGPAVPLAFLGVLRAGAAFAVLDAELPRQRLHELVKDLEPVCVLADSQSMPATVELNCPVFEIGIDQPWEEVDFSPPEVRPEDPIYIIFTSGTTGTPRGVAVPHRGITNRFAWMTRLFGAGAAQAALQTTRHVYDSAVWQLLWPLTLGGRTVIPLPEAVMDAREVRALVHRNRVTITDFVPSVFDSIVPNLVANDQLETQLGCLQVIILGGEAISPSPVYKFKQAFPSVRIFNLYGPTEASIGCIFHEVMGAEGAVIPIGRAIDNVSAWVVDSYGQLAPLGVVGEVHLSGACLAEGYHGDARKTAAAFLPCPFAEAGARMYRTGDLVRRRPDGNLEFLGRRDDQIKIRGIRIEPAEIEYAMMSHGGVREALAIARTTPEGKLLTAYFVPSDSSRPVAPEELREHLRRQLPLAMIPAHFVSLDALPLTRGGKVDRKALPTPAPAVHSIAAPATETEQKIADIWCELLGVDRVGLHDDFFDQGGHSLLATQVMARINATFGTQISVASFLRGSATPLGLALAVDEELAGGSLADGPAHADRTANGSIEETETPVAIASKCRS